MIKVFKYTIVTSIFLFLLLLPLTGTAQHRIDITPRISVGQNFSDNIYLDNSNEKSDYMTTTSPGINMKISSSNTSLDLDYSPTWVWYNEYDENNTVRHRGNIAFNQNLSKNCILELSDTYVKSEEPLETTEGVEGIRKSRNTYQRNTGNAGFQYLFGLKNIITAGYKHYLLENDDVELDDGSIQSPSLNITYWLNVKNSVDLEYEFTDANFSRDDNSVAGDDYDGNSAGLKYAHYFMPHTWGSMAYRFTSRNFIGDTEDYDIHEATVGLGYSFSKDLSLNLDGGIFTQVKEVSDNETGYKYNAMLSKNFKNGNLIIGGRGGWDESYLDAERTGFTRFWSAETRFEYLVMKRLRTHLGGSFRQNKDSENRKWGTWRANCGLKLSFYRWFSLSLDYTYAQRDDDIDTEDFVENMVMLSLTANRLYRW